MPDLFSPKQLAEYLQLSQRTVYRLLERGDLPAVKVGGQWRFRKSAVDEWLDVGMQRLDHDTLHALETDDESRAAIPTLSDLLTPENARIAVPAGSRDDVVRAFVDKVHLPEGVPADLVAERVLERERLCTTAMSGGVALLHTTRSLPRVLKASDLVAMGRVASPVEFGALDGSRTDLLVLMLARSERVQLGLLAKLTRLCQEPGFLAALRGAASAEAVVTLVRETASRVFESAL
ncbi:MAG: PTS sugar transporter subunit IIA [Gemmatimonadota bacterium]|nr:PTS sugar transporter subunit IIA [Gemmatimonadota bacterium]MDE3174093.1 PTS sugar transporter subunit IIA [Gemmatimonadota bacterium]MDE3215695.1 PTS sugar transporter subunit IIA [Gemmatimonadota bacterium]